MEVRRVEALCEPAVELGESLAGCGTLVLALPEPAKDHRRPQFQGLRLLAPGRVQARRNEASALSKASASRRSVSSPSSRWSSGLIGSTRVMKDVNPYIEARREWDDRYLDLVRARRWWQLTAASELALLGVVG